MLPVMREHINDFLQRYPRLADQGGADNQCRIATDQLVEALDARGIRATAIWVRGHRTEPKHSARRALDADRHRLVRLPGGSFVDVTRRQFDPDAPHPMYYGSEAELAAHWRQIDRGPADGEASDQVWHSLDLCSGQNSRP